MVAFFTDDGEIFSIDLDDPEKHVKRSDEYLINFLRNNTNTIGIKDTTIYKSLKRLYYLVNEEEFWNLTLIVLDQETSESLRYEAMEELEKSLKENHARYFLKGAILSSHYLAKYVKHEKFDLSIFEKHHRCMSLFEELVVDND